LKSEQKSPSSLTIKLRAVRMILTDVDGVMTDGRIIYGSDGIEYKCFNVHDGYGISRALSKGLLMGIISGRISKVTAIRAKRLKIAEVYQGNEEKITVYKKIKAKYRLIDSEFCYIGDDEFDIPLLRKVGISAAPSDAIESVRREVDYVTKSAGGHGALRELIDAILKAKKLI